MEIEVYEEYKKTRSKTAVMPSTTSRSYYDEENIKYFTENELKAIIANSNEFYQMIFLLLFETASRISEARALKLSDLDKNKIKITALKQRGKRKFRVVPISDALRALILQHRLDNNLSESDFIFAKKSGKTAVTQQSIDEMLKKVCAELSIAADKAHCHAFRHTRAITLLEAGESLITVKNILSHSSIQNTLIYLKYSNRDFENAITRANQKIGLK